MTMIRYDQSPNGSGPQFFWLLLWQWSDMTNLFEDVVAHKIGFVDDIDIDQAA